MKDREEIFNYTYSAKQQQEIQHIRKKYAAPEEDKMELVRRLDNRVSQKATTVAMVVGVLGALLLGIGMSCALVWQGIWFLVGIPVGLIGMAVMSVAYPLYNHTLKRERKKVAPEILRLTDELLK